MAPARPYYSLVEEWVDRNIASQALPAGTRVTVASVADRLGISRSPVKRALDMLAHRHRLTVDGRMGYIVGPPSVEPAPVANLFALPLSDPADLTAAESRPGWERILDAVTEAVATAAPFGIWQVSEADLCSHYEVSRTVVREVLARLQERGALGKDRAGHWIAGPLSARMLDEEHGLRVLLEPAALLQAAPALRADAPHLRATLDRADPHCSPEVMAVLETGLHEAALPHLQNRRMAATLRLLTASRHVNRLFATHVARHDESALLAEHRLVVDHIALGDGPGAAAALRHHIEADHIRTRARLRVLSVFPDPVTAPWLSRVA
jgi:DNA-binding GntR family transcriptional regulator